MKPGSTAAATTHTLRSKSLVGWNLWLCRTHQFQSCPQSAAHHSGSPWRMWSEPALADSPDTPHCFTLVVQMALANLKIRKKRSGCADIARLALNWLSSAQLSSGQSCQCVVTCPDCAATGPLLLMPVQVCLPVFQAYFGLLNVQDCLEFGTGYSEQGWE